MNCEVVAPKSGCALESPGSCGLLRPRPQTRCAEPEGWTWAAVVLKAPQVIVCVFRAGNLEWEQYFPSLVHMESPGDLSKLLVPDSHPQIS